MKFPSISGHPSSCKQRAKRGGNELPSSPSQPRSQVVRSLVLTVGLLGILGSGLDQASAAETTWITAGTGNWSDEGNWSPAVPIAGDSAVMDMGSSIINTTFSSLGDVRVGVSGSATLSINDGGLLGASVLHIADEVDSSGTVNLNQGGELDVTQITKGAGTALLTINGGTVRATASHSEFISGFALGEVTFGNFGATFDTNGFNIGISAPLSGAGGLTKVGSGTLTLSGSNRHSLTIVEGGTLTVASGASITHNAGFMAIGDQEGDNATLEIEQGALVTTSQILLGRNSGAIGHANVSGTLDAPAEVVAGYGGTGVLTVKSGGVVTSGYTYIGSNTGSDGTITIESGGSFNNNDLILIGFTPESKGTLTIENGGYLYNGGDAWIGNDEGSSGAVTVSGSWENAGGLNLTRSGTLTVTSGGHLVNDGSTEVSVDAGSNAALIIEAGGYFTNGGDTKIGSEEGSSGMATVSGSWENTGNFKITGSSSVIIKAGGHLTNDKSMGVGHDSGSGSTLTIESGGLLTNKGDTWIGRDAGSKGAVNVSGSWDNTGGIKLTRTSSLTVKTGGHVTSGGGIEVGYDTGSSGTLVIENGGYLSTEAGYLSPGGETASQATVSGTWINANYLSVGYSGTSTLTIGVNGYVSSPLSILGETSNAKGTAIVSGSWVNAIGLAVGAGGTGDLTIHEGGYVYDAIGTIGDGAGSKGTAGVSGTWINTTAFAVGNEGKGTLNIEDGGFVRGPSVYIGQQASASGTVNIKSGGVLSANQIFKGSGTASLIFDGGTVRARADQANFFANFTSTTAKFSSGGAIFDTNGFDIGVAAVLSGEGGLTKSGSGTLVLTGENLYTGTTTISAGVLALEDAGRIGSGDLEMNGGTFDITGLSAATYSLSETHTLSGYGIIDAIGKTLQLAGTLALGNSLGELTVNGDFTLESTASSVFEINGTGAGEFDELIVDGHLTLGGELTLSTNFLYTPGQRVKLFSWTEVEGSFSAILGTDLENGLSWDTSMLYMDGSIAIIPEPTTTKLILILGGGLMAFSFAKRRKRHCTVATGGSGERTPFC